MTFFCPPLRISIIFFLTVFSLISCASLDQNFYGVPGETVADSYGRREIMSQIKWLTKIEAKGRDCELKVLDTRQVDTMLNTIIEHWDVDYCGQTETYKVRVARFSNGSMTYIVTYPSNYQRGE